MIKPPYLGQSVDFVANEAYEREQVRLQTAPTVEDLPAMRALSNRLKTDIAHLDRVWEDHLGTSDPPPNVHEAYRRSMALRPHEVRLSRHIYDLEDGSNKARTLSRLCRVVIDAQAEQKRELAKLPAGQTSAAVERLTLLIEDTNREMDAIEGKLHCMAAQQPDCPTAAPPTPPVPQGHNRQPSTQEPLATFRGIFAKRPPKAPRGI